jgi:putative ABC transport system permease protein
VIPYRLISAHWRKNAVRTAFTTLSVGIAVFLFCMLRTVVTSLESMVHSSSSERLMTSSALSLFTYLPVAMQPKIEGMEGVERVCQWTWFGGVYIDSSKFFARFGVDAERFRLMYGDQAANGGVFKMPAEQWEAFAKEQRACIVGAGLVKQYGFELGGTIPLQGDIFRTDLQLQVRGIYESGNPAYDDTQLFFHWKYLDEAAGRPGRVSTFAVDLKKGTEMGDLGARIDDYFRSSATPTLSQSEQAFNAQFLTMWGNVGLLFNAIGTTVLFACFLIVLNTMLLAARERIVEVGVLKTLGFADGGVLLLYVAEGLLLTVLGGGVGIGASGLLAGGQALTLGPVTIPVFLLELRTILIASGLAVALGLVAGLAPGVMALRLRIVEALRRFG